MSVYNRLYIAQIAPCSRSWKEAIYRGVDVPDRGRVWTESFSEDAFIATGKPVPVVLSHEEDKPVGKVETHVVHNAWHVVSFTVDHSRTLSSIALDRLRIGAPVSIGFRSLAHDELLAQEGVKRHTVARLDELSVLRADEIPGYKGAKITQIIELPSTSPAAVSTASDRTAAGDTVILDRGDEEMAELIAAADAAVTRTGVIVRKNIGRVTAVGGVPVRRR